MIRGLTIRFAVLCVVVGTLVVLVNVLHAGPALAMMLLMVTLVGGSLILTSYCIAHEDEIPTRDRGRHDRGT